MVPFVGPEDFERFVNEYAEKQQEAASAVPFLKVAKMGKQKGLLLSRLVEGWSAA